MLDWKLSLNTWRKRVSWLAESLPFGNLKGNTARLYIYVRAESVKFHSGMEEQSRCSTHDQQRVEFEVCCVVRKVVLLFWLYELHKPLDWTWTDFFAKRYAKRFSTASLPLSLVLHVCLGLCFKVSYWLCKLHCYHLFGCFWSSSNTLRLVQKLPHQVGPHTSSERLSANWEHPAVCECLPRRTSARFRLKNAMWLSTYQLVEYQERTETRPFFLSYRADGRSCPRLELSWNGKVRILIQAGYNREWGRWKRAIRGSPCK